MSIGSDLDAAIADLKARLSAVERQVHPPGPVPVPVPAPAPVPEPAPTPIPAPVPVPTPTPEPSPTPVVDLATVITSDGTVWSFRDDGRVLANGMPFDNYGWGTVPPITGTAFRQRGTDLFLLMDTGAWAGWTGAVWQATSLDAAGQPISVAPTPAPVPAPGPGPAPSPSPSPLPNTDPLYVGPPPADSGPDLPLDQKTLFKPSDFKLKGVYDIAHQFSDYLDLAYGSGWTFRRNAQGELMGLVASGGSYTSGPDVYEFNLSGLKQGIVNKLVVANRWKGEDLFAGTYNVGPGLSAWGAMFIDPADPATLYYTGSTYLISQPSANITRMKLGPDGTVREVRGGTLHGVFGGLVYGGFAQLPQAFRDRYKTGRIAVGWGGGTMLEASIFTPQSLGLSAIAIPDFSAYPLGADIPASDYQVLADHSSGNRATDWFHDGSGRLVPDAFDRGARLAGARNWIDGGNRHDMGSGAHTGGAWADVIGKIVRWSRNCNNHQSPQEWLKFNSTAQASVSGSIDDHTIQLGDDTPDAAMRATHAMIYAGAGAGQWMTVAKYDPQTNRMSTLEAVTGLDATSRIDMGYWLDPPNLGLFDQQFWLGVDWFKNGKKTFIVPAATINGETCYIASRDSNFQVTLTKPLAQGDLIGVEFTAPDPKPVERDWDDGMQWSSHSDIETGAPDGRGRFLSGDSYWQTGCYIDEKTKHGLVLICDGATGKVWTENGGRITCEGYQAELHIVDPRELGECAEGTREPWAVQPTEMALLEPVNADIARLLTTLGPDPTIYRGRSSAASWGRATTAWYDPLYKEWWVYGFALGEASSTRLYRFEVNYATAPEVLLESPDGTEVSKAQDGALETVDGVLVDQAGDRWTLDETPRRWGPNAVFLGFDIQVNGGAPKRPVIGLNTIARRMIKVAGTIRTVDASGTWYGPGGPELDPTQTWETPPPPSVGSRQMVGGWQLPKDLAGPLAIDFTTMRARVSAGSTIQEFQLPPMGTGSDSSKWPMAQLVNTVPAWWRDVMVAHLQADMAVIAAQMDALRADVAHDHTAELMALGTQHSVLNYRLGYDPWNAYTSGLLLWRGKYWAAPKVYYDTAPPLTMQIIAEDGETLTLPLQRQAFAGFVKRGPGQDPYIGCGGDESGQGGACGPTLAKMDGTVLITYGRPFDLGPIDAENRPANWNQRAPRPPNYTCAWGVDSWVAFNPRVINGVLEGRWAAERVYGGGLVLPEGDVCYWARLALGNIDYGWQMSTFVPETQRRTYEYRYDATTFAFKNYQLTGLGQVGGQELDADGRVYLTFGPMDPLGGRGYTALYLGVFA
jgi:hypothetical protein